MPTPLFFLQDLCQRGQALLSQTDYLAAERVLMEAEQIAWEAEDWQTLSRLYMPLQEARRQKRQIALAGTIRLDLRVDQIAPEQLLAQYSSGEFLLASHGSITAARTVRKLAAERNLFLECFLAAYYVLGDMRVYVIAPLATSPLPRPEKIGNIDQLLHQVPVHSIVVTEGELAATTPAQAMSLWQKLHMPFLTAADAEADPIRRMEGYRRTILVDNACELAHQKLSDVAAKMK